MNKLRSVKDDPPEMWKDVFAYVRWGEIPFIGHLKANGEWCVDKSHVDAYGDAFIIDDVARDSVVFWCDLPEAPKWG
jgi:hypothetical protein